MNKLFALILVAGAFTSCDKKEEKVENTTPAKVEVKTTVIVDEKSTEMKADTTKKNTKKVVVVEEEKSKK